MDLTRDWDLRVKELGDLREMNDLVKLNSRDNENGLSELTL